jgi:hypothetical protein
MLKKKDGLFEEFETVKILEPNTDKRFRKSQGRMQANDNYFVYLTDS